MKRIDDNCVGCTSVGLPCLGSACPNSPREVEFCDDCADVADVYADYYLNDSYGESALCEECLEETLNQMFKEMSLSEKIDLMNTLDDINIRLVD